MLSKLLFIKLWLYRTNFLCQNVIEHLFKHKPGQKFTVTMFASSDKDVILAAAVCVAICCGGEKRVQSSFLVCP